MDKEAFLIKNPWVLVYDGPDDTVVVKLHYADKKDGGYEAYGLIIADIITTVAHEFGANKEDILRWVRKELDDPTIHYQNPH